ncbi:MAG: hypothetical protein BA863_00970 [Desulfovibrio sp. S3730MH75]|nr:MAG: hypothetical protein BA863_00970 [Desulfovibrio sp. S3730MH75]
MEIATIVTIGKVAIKLGEIGWDAYCEANRVDADAFSEERCRALLDDHRDTDEILAAHGVSIPE